MHILVSPSILSADFAKLAVEAAALEAAGADYIHIDIMDGHFVPNLTFGPQIVRGLRPHTALPFDVHLMINEPEKFIDEFIDAGSNMITVHLESNPHICRILEMIRSKGIRAGVSLCPSTPETALQYVYQMVDRILVMTVNPGFAAQSFMPSQLVKLQAIRQEIIRQNLPVELAVDGGMNPQTARLAIEAGANVIVAGHSVFKNQDYKANIMALRQGRVSL